ncbi:MAG: hypothetical protein KAS23_14175, partial [Anaerohalosphaera sp.]|nr:hypothetical protein [Anaerohalosphaera sp.]
RFVVNFENNDWPVRFICERIQASRSLLIAANNQQLDLRMLDKPELTEWINATRKLAASKVPPADDTPTHTEKAVEAISDVPAKVESPGLPKLTVGINDPNGNIGEREAATPVQDPNGHKAKEADGKPIQIEIVNLPGFPFGKLKVDDPNDGSVKKADVEEETVIEPDKEVDLPKPDEEVDLPEDKKPKTGKWWLWLIVLLGIVAIAGSWHCLKKHTTDSLDEQLGDQLDGHENLQQLIWLTDQQHQDLGNIATLREVIIGKAVGSSIYIDDENVEERHVRIFKSGKKVKVQNLAASAISVDGKQLNRKQKTDLLLPADIELAGGVVVSLTSEDVNSNSI